METVTVKIRRHDPALPGDPKRLEQHTIPYQEGMRIMDALLHIFEQEDHTLAFRCSCKIGNCKVCLVKANGKKVLGCQERLEDGMIIEPLQQFEEVRDLVYNFHKKVKHKK